MATESQDFLITDEGDTTVTNGDFKVGKSDAQHIQHIIDAFKGEWLEAPTLGVGIRYYENGQINSTELSKLVRIELQKDGYKLHRLTVEEEGTINVDATRIRD